VLVFVVEVGIPDTVRCAVQIRDKSDVGLDLDTEFLVQNQGFGKRRVDDVYEAHFGCSILGVVVEVEGTIQDWVVTAPNTTCIERDDPSLVV